MESTPTSINFIRILNVLKKRWILVVLLAVIFGFGSHYYSSNFITKRYRASVQMYVYNEEKSYTVNGQTYTNGITAADLGLRSLVISDCLVVCSLPDVIDNVNTGLKNAGYSKRISAGNISASADQTTRFFTISVTCDDQKTCNKACELIADASLKKIKDLLKVDNVRAVSYHKSGGPISPNVASNTTSGVCFGIAVALGIIALMAMGDRTIKNEDEFNDLFPGVPVIGAIPEFNLANEKLAAARGRKSSGKSSKAGKELPSDLGSFKSDNLS
ncbi:MAG: hypothetical protein IJL87_07830 [Clostridia bacterium]|nr:hypothetical protein [Clostridia bacterium]